MEITRVTASAFRKAFGALSARAVREPVMITRRGRDHLVVLSAEEYRRLKRSDPRVGLTAELPQEWIEALRSGKVKPSRLPLP